MYKPVTTKQESRIKRILEVCGNCFGILNKIQKNVTLPIQNLPSTLVVCIISGIFEVEI